MTDPYNKPPKKNGTKMRWVLLGAVIMLLILTLIGVFIGDGETAEKKGDREPTPEDASNTAVIGEPGTVGDLEVTVNSVETDQSYGDEFTRVEPAGEFQIVSLTVENVGDEAATIDDSSVTLVDNDGAQHSTSADTMFSNDQDLFLQDINPGNHVSGEAVFDVPVDTKVKEITVAPYGLDLREPLTVKVE